MYEYLEHTADAGIRATGADLAEAFQEAALGMLHLQVPPGDGPETPTCVSIEVESEDEEELLLDWLSRLLAEQDVSGVLFTEATVDDVRRGEHGLRLRGRAAGVPVEALGDRIESEVKAVTAYGLRVAIRSDGVEVRFVVDL